MRLQLTCALVAGAIAARATGVAADGADSDEDRVATTLRIYADDDHVTVVSPAVHGVYEAHRVALELDVAADAVSAASVDIVTSASPTAVTERRLEVGVGAAIPLSTTSTARAGALVSHENDYDSYRLALGGVIELASRNTTLDLRVRGGVDQATDVSDPSFRGERRVAGAVATATQVIDRHTVFDLIVDGQWGHGWHGSPYRRVEVADPRLPMFTLWREATPQRRVTVATALRLRRAFAGRWFATGWLRGYTDDWAIQSVTATVEVRRALADRTLVGLSTRGYLQDGAEFWRRREPDGLMPPRYRTADRTLGPMASAYVELVGERRVAGSATLVGAAGVMSSWFFDSPVQRQRRALTVTASVIVPF